MVDKQKNKDNESAYKKSEEFGIKVLKVKESFKAYYMKEPTLLGGRNKIIDVGERVFPVSKKIDMINWICLYKKRNFDDADNLYNSLKKASKGFGLTINEPKWIEMPNNAYAKDWTDTAADYIGKGKEDYSFAIFLIDQGDKKEKEKENNEKLYSQLKKHSLCKNGYVSQVVKVQSLRKKGVMSICSKILLQINAKLGGASYQIKNDNYKDMMVIGIDSSYVKGKGRCIAMVATINNSFSDFYNREDIIKEDDEENIGRIELCVRSFIEEIINLYEGNKQQLPKNIIIYRQGVSLQQKKYLKEEINQIDEICKDKNIKYYYILVNTKTTFKFFEFYEEEQKRGYKGKNKYYKNKYYNNNNRINEDDENDSVIKYNNPESGLLILDGVTNRNYFEFYIQPQEVTGGSATPTCFHVAYGNLKLQELIPKLTYDLCYIYSNWQGAVRVPNVIKAAEKLSKMTAKYTFGVLNSSLKFGQAYL